MHPFIRSTFFNLCLWVNSIFFSLTGFLTFFLPYRFRYWYITRWSHIAMWLAKHVLGITYVVHGLENVPKEAAIVAVNHQSAWETIATQMFLPPQTWIIKRELGWVPFFGWGLSMLKPIAINRRSKNAAAQVVKDGKQRLAEGLWVLIFPEGTRQKPGTFGLVRRGVVHFAFDAGSPILPIAHNAGYVWPKNSWTKYPGVVDVYIGTPLKPQDFPDSEALLEELTFSLQALFRKTLR